MDPETIEDFRRILRARWERVHHRRRGTMSAVEGLLQSHEPDWEDGQSGLEYYEYFDEEDFNSTEDDLAVIGSMVRRSETH